MILTKKPFLFQVENSLGSLELEVMRTIWKGSRTTVKEVVNILKQKRPIAYTTVMTVMDNLYKKGFLAREKIKKSYQYSPKAHENYVVAVSLSRVFHDLNTDYGRRKVLFSVFADIMPKISITIIPPYPAKIVRTFQAPVSYGISLTLLLTLFGLSAFDLLQNLSFFGSTDYLSLLISDPINFADRLYLFVAAFFESLPMVNILTTAVSFILLAVLIKKLFKFLSLTTTSITKLGGETH